eukprot:scaffold876_cov243-Pinguiococcus_pyrenoidosus.AAC.42
MEKVIQCNLSAWLSSKAQVPAPHAVAAATKLVEDGWSTADIMLAELQATEDADPQFLDFFDRKADRRRCLLALQEHAKLLEERKRGEPQAEGDEETKDTAAQEMKAAEISEWLCETGLTSACAAAASSKLVEDGYDDVRPRRGDALLPLLLDSRPCFAYQCQTGGAFLAKYVERPGDARKVAEALAAKDKEGDAPEADAEVGEETTDSFRMEVQVNRSYVGSARQQPYRPPRIIAIDDTTSRASRILQNLSMAAEKDIAPLDIDGLNEKETTKFLGEVAALSHRDLVARQRLSKAGACKAIMQGLKRFPGSHSVQYAGCQAAVCVMTNQPRIVREFEVSIPFRKGWGIEFGVVRLQPSFKDQNVTALPQQDMGLRRFAQDLVSKHATNGQTQLVAQETLSKLDGKAPVRRVVDTSTLPW